MLEKIRIELITPSELKTYTKNVEGLSEWLESHKTCQQQNENKAYVVKDRSNDYIIAIAIHEITTKGHLKKYCFFAPELAKYQQSVLASNYLNNSSNLEFLEKSPQDIKAELKEIEDEIKYYDGAKLYGSEATELAQLKGEAAFLKNVLIWKAMEAQQQQQYSSDISNLKQKGM